MREKATIIKYLNTRAARRAVFSMLCRIPFIRDFFNYYDDPVCFEDVAEEDSVRSLKIDPLREYSIAFEDAELRDVMQCERSEIEDIQLVYKMGRLRDVMILGSSGVTVVKDSRQVLQMGRRLNRVPANWVVARPLKAVEGDDSITYVNLLGVRKGHRHFAHFFLDTLVPVMVYLKTWHDPSEKVIFLVREDLSSIQRDTFAFLTEDFAGISFETLPAGCKMCCRSSMFLTSQNKRHGLDNALARDCMQDIANLFLRHYGIAPSPGGEGRRIYLSREGAEVRGVQNESALKAMLSRYGFESYEPSALPFAKQAELFASADTIVSAHGSALMNLMFCRPRTKVLEFFPANYRGIAFIRLSRTMELDYHYLFAGKGEPLKLAFAMDTDELEAAIRTLLDSSGDSQSV